VSGVVVATSIGVGYYTWSELKPTGKQGFFKYGANCEKNSAGAIVGGPPECSTGSRNQALNITAYGIGAAVSLVGIYAIYKGWVERSEQHEGTSQGARERKRKSFAVTPVVSTDGAGATVRFDW
jgi:hypothetical protein